MKLHVSEVLRDHPPLKQGLRLLPNAPLYLYIVSPRPSSTKTRIKTEGFTKMVVSKTKLSETILH